MATPEKRVYVHIGVPNSGGTFLPVGLTRNRRALREAGVLYPVTGESPALDVCRSHRSWGRKRSEVEGSWDTLCRKAHEHAGTTVISQELLAAASSRQVAGALTMLNGLGVHVVVTAGDLASQIRAAWEAEVKQGWRSGFEEYLRSIMSETHDRETAHRFWGAQDLPDVLSRWTSRLPAANVHVVTCPPEPGDVGRLWQRFAGVVGFDPEAFPPPAPGRAEHSSGTPLLPVQVQDDLVRISERWAKEIDKAGYSVHGDLAELIPAPPMARA